MFMGIAEDLRKTISRLFQVKEQFLTLLRLLLTSMLLFPVLLMAEPHHVTN